MDIAPIIKPFWGEAEAALAVADSLGLDVLALYSVMSAEFAKRHDIKNEETLGEIRARLRMTEDEIFAECKVIATEIANGPLASLMKRGGNA